MCGDSAVKHSVSNPVIPQLPPPPPPQGRNQFCTEVITKRLEYLTWTEAMTCLTEEKLPDALRAKYCDLIVGKLFVLHIFFVFVTSFRKVLNAISCCTLRMKHSRQDRSFILYGRKNLVSYHTCQGEIDLCSLVEILDWLLFSLKHIC